MNRFIDRHSPSSGAPARHAAGIAAALALLCAFAFVAPVSPAAAAPTDIVPAGHRAYSFLNALINDGLVNGYGRGFSVTRVNRDTMARYLSLVFDGKPAEEIVDSGRIRESDLSTLSELVNEFIEELSSKYSSRLSSLLEKSMKVRSLLDKRALAAGSTGGTTAPASGAIFGVPADGADAIPGGAAGTVANLPTGKFEWERKFEQSLTMRNIETKNGPGYELNNAEKKAGFTTDLILNYTGSASDDFGELKVEESAFFQQKNKDLYDYMVRYSNKETGGTMSLGYKLRPDITEYTFRGEELKGLHAEYAAGQKALSSAFLGEVKIDNANSDEIGVFGVTSRLQLSDRYALRLTHLQADNINRVASVENIYRPDADSLHELEFIGSRYFDVDDQAYEYRWKQAVKKLTLSFKYKNIGENFGTVMNPSMLADIRKTDLRHFETVANYRFTPFITNTTTLIHSNENNALQAAPRIPIETSDYTTIFLSAVPKRPKYMIYLKDQHKTGADGTTLSGKDDRLKLALFKVDHDFGRFYPRLGYTLLKLNNDDRTAAPAPAVGSIPIKLDTDSRTTTAGFDYLLTKKLTLKFDRQVTDSDSSVYTVAGGVGILTPSQSLSTVNSLALELKIDDIQDLTLSLYTERRTRSEDVDKKLGQMMYRRKLNKDMDAALVFERIRYADRITPANTYDSDEFALTVNARF